MALLRGGALGAVGLGTSSRGTGRSQLSGISTRVSRNVTCYTAHNVLFFEIVVCWYIFKLGLFNLTFKLSLLLISYRLKLYKSDLIWCETKVCKFCHSVIFFVRVFLAFYLVFVFLYFLYFYVLYMYLNIYLNVFVKTMLIYMVYYFLFNCTTTIVFSKDFLRWWTRLV